MLAAKTYVPLLKVKQAEIEAYRQLSTATKDITFPIFSLRPWPNAGELTLAVDRLREAIGQHPFALTLDSERYNYPSKRPIAKRQFDELFDPSNGFSAYFDFVENIPNAVPVIQATTDANCLLTQLGRAESLDRGVVIHQQRGSIIPITDSILSLSEFYRDTIFVVDAAWSRDPLQLQAWSIPIIGKILDYLPEAEIVVMATSFPDSFKDIVGTKEELAHEIHLFNAVRQRFQRADLKYGDWASTRISQSGGGGSIPSRVDIPRPMSWQIFRADPLLDTGFRVIAQQAIEHDCFAQVPDCWGKRLVAATDDEGTGVKSTRSNTSARINMHITIQADADETIDVDEQPYVD